MISPIPAAVTPQAPPEPLQVIAEALRGLQFGTVTVIVQDGRVVQVERTEKRRLASPGRGRGTV